MKVTVGSKHDLPPILSRNGRLAVYNRIMRSDLADEHVQTACQLLTLSNSKLASRVFHHLVQDMFDMSDDGWKSFLTSLERTGLATVEWADRRVIITFISERNRNVTEDLILHVSKVTGDADWVQIPEALQNNSYRLRSLRYLVLAQADSLRFVNTGEVKYVTFSIDDSPWRDDVGKMIEKYFQFELQILIPADGEMWNLGVVSRPSAAVGI